MLTAMLFTTASAEKKSVFLYAGQSNADGREYVVNLPSYMKEGTSPYSPYTHLKWANICGNPAAKTFGKREMANGERYAFCDVTNYWIDQSAGDDFYAIKCAYGGIAPLPYTNLLMPVVGNGSAPAGSFVLTTSHGTTQFTKTTNAVSLENQAYLMLPEATKEAYGFQINKSREEKTYVITSIFDKGTTLTLSDQLHHTIVDGSTSKGVYLPTNAAGLDDNFAFDNSGLWQTDGKNGSLGQTYKSTIYCSVLSLENGDRVKFDLTSNCVLKAVQNGILDGVKADDTLISGTTYTVSIAEGSTVNIDLKMTATSNRNGFTKITLWKAPATPTGIKALVSKKRKDTALYDLTGRQLQAQPRNGIYIKNGRKMMVTR